MTDGDARRRPEDADGRRYGAKREDAGGGVADVSPAPRRRRRRTRRYLADLKARAEAGGEPYRLSDDAAREAAALAAGLKQAWDQAHYQRDALASVPRRRGGESRAERYRDRDAAVRRLAEGLLAESAELAENRKALMRNVRERWRRKRKDEGDTLAEEFGELPASERQLREILRGL